MSWPIIRFDEIDSTNLEAQRRIERGQLEPTWIAAAAQTSGRGRSGRPWQSLPGNLLASVLLPLTCPPGVLHHLSLVSGLALYNAVSACIERSAKDLDLRLKWPNDLLLNEAKLAGILVESSIVGDRTVAIIGIGVNIQSTPELPDRATTSLDQHGISTTPDDLLDQLNITLPAAIELWDGGANFARIRETWLSYSFPLKHPLTVNTAAARVQGAFAGLDEDGALLIRTTNGKIEKFNFGDVAVGGEPATDVNGEPNNT